MKTTNVNSACIAIQLFNGDYIFADKVCPRGNNLLYVPRGQAQKIVNGVHEWNLIACDAIVEITVGIYDI